MEEHRIELPTAMTVHAAKHLLEKVAFFPRKAPMRFVLSFHPKFTHFEPFAVAMLASWARYWAKHGVAIRCENTSARGVAYAQRLGLFDHIPGVDLPPVIEHEEAGRFVPLQHITVRADVGKFISEIGSILRNPQLIRIGQHALSEMTRNVVEHAQADGFVCAQYYKSNKHIAIGVADCGLGVRKSLEQAYGFRTDAEALLGALRPGISGRTRNPYSAADNAGLGLFVARALAKASKQYFLLVSGGAAFRQDKAPPQTRQLHPMRDPAKERHRIFDEINPWQGTAVAVDLRGMDRSFDHVMQSISEAISEGGDAKIVRSRIRFEP